MRVIQSRLAFFGVGPAKIFELRAVARSFEQCRVITHSVTHMRGKRNAICDRGAKYELGFFRAMIFFGNRQVVILSEAKDLLADFRKADPSLLRSSG